MTSQIFTTARGAGEPKAYGTVHSGRYHMPLLPDEKGPKSGAPWVSRGCRRMTNLVGAGEDTRALSVWEQGMGLIGLALSPELYEELVTLVDQAQADGVDFTRLRDYVELKEALAGTAHDQDKQEASIIGRAKRAARAHAAAVAGTVRHTAWEHYSNTGQLIGTKAVRESTTRTAALLAEAGLEIVPGLSERVVRNLAIDAVGRFDNVLMQKSTGNLIMADLKTKSTAFYSWMTVDAQLAGYANAEWMLTEDGQGYEAGPGRWVDGVRGCIMHVPSDGSPAYLRTADLVTGWRTCLVSAELTELRAYGKSAERGALAPWENLDEAS